jgi:hypothetical protein
MAETYRKAKILNYINLLTVRKRSLLNQLLQKEFEENADFLKGQLSAIELILDELADEFELGNCQSLEGEK